MSRRWAKVPGHALAGAGVGGGDFKADLAGAPFVAEARSLVGLAAEATPLAALAYGLTLAGVDVDGGRTAAGVRGDGVVDADARLTGGGVEPAEIAARLGWKYSVMDPSWSGALGLAGGGLAA